MKINWGTGLVIGMLSFIAFILFLVIKMTTNEDLNHDLVTEDYYMRELRYQDEIDAETNMKDFEEEIQGEKIEDGWLIKFPKEIDAGKISGTVFLYRPSDKRLDFDFPIQLSNSNLIIPDHRLLEGRWDITINWIYNSKNYLYKKAITY